MVKINGSSFALQYKRTTYRPIDSSSVFDTIEDARVYARNTDAEAYFPYAGQLVSTLENGGAVYKLSKDDSIPETDGKRHFKLDPIGSKNDNDDRYVRKDIAETIEKLMTFIEGINVKGTATLNEIMLLKDLVSENFSAGGSGFGIYRDADGNYHLDIDFVDIRKKLSVEDIQVQQSTYVGAGSTIPAAASSATAWRTRAHTGAAISRPLIRRGVPCTTPSRRMTRPSARRST